MRLAVPVRQLVACWAFALLAVACVSPLPLTGAACPCPKGYCCAHGKCVTLPNAACDPENDAGSVTPGRDARADGMTDAMTDAASVASDAQDAGAAPDAALDAAAPSPDELPGLLCGQALPDRFAILCGGCHTSAGAANPRYPDLFAYAGTAAQLRGKVRSVGTDMAAYPAALISDADLDAVAAHFKSHARPALETLSLGPVVPLFAKGVASNPPIVFKRDDGAIVTRGAGRVRSRHEGPLDTNQPFMEWPSNYFTMRTYGWIVEDFTPLGQSKLLITFLPNGPLAGMTTLRAWKAFGNGDVFTMNLAMSPNVALPPMTVNGGDLAMNYSMAISPFSEAQQGQLTANARAGVDGRIVPGVTCELELGIVYSGAVQPAGSRPNYYTDTFRYQVGKGGITATNYDPYSGNRGTFGPSVAAQSGGDTTNVWAYYLPETQFDQMALNVQHENVQHFVEGRRLFHTDFSDGSHRQQGATIAPFPEQAGKADPKAQQLACQDCHVNNGGGAPLGERLDKATTVIRLAGGGALGRQLQPSEGHAAVAHELTKNVTVGEGVLLVLSMPELAVTANDGAALAYSTRIASRLIGLGLLEAIDERTILARADQGDCDADGISGRPSFIEDPVTHKPRLGRFGWKAEGISLEKVASEQAWESMGVSSSMFPDAGKAELGPAEVDQLVTYLRLLAVPGQRSHGDESVTRGERIFQTIGCAACHVSDVVTGPNHPFAELRNQAIRPYTDLLLHDMGAELTDYSGVPVAGLDPMAPAASSEWRTPPLWGVGLVDTISGQTSLLHDGRAKNVLEAVLWHGGEAEVAKQAVVTLSGVDREALLAFLGSL